MLHNHDTRALDLARNAIEHVAAAIERILDPEIDECEIIPVDDGSPEDIRPVIEP